MTSFLSKGTTFPAIIATMNLLLMAAIANDGSMGNSTVSSGTMNATVATTTTRLASTRPTTLSTTTTSTSMSGKKISTKSTSTATTTTALPPPPPPPIKVLTASSLVKAKGYETYKGIGDRSTSGVAENSSIPFPIIHVTNDSPPSPFITENSTELTAQIRSNAHIPCIVRNSGDGVTVSWIRRKDYHLLTVGLQTYSSDDRFQAIHAQSPEDWTLKIKYVQPRDAGVYECQVSTHPPSSIFVKLNVVEARAEISGGPDKYIKSGSSLRLICELKQSTEEPDYVFWYQGLKMINYDPSRQVEVTTDRYTSTLVLHNVQKSDSGNYSCVPSNSIPASIFVHILNGENPAAMQHGSHSTSCVPCPPLWFLSFLLSIILQTLYFEFLTHSSVRTPVLKASAAATASITNTTTARKASSKSSTLSGTNIKVALKSENCCFLSR